MGLEMLRSESMVWDERLEKENEFQIVGSTSWNGLEPKARLVWGAGLHGVRRQLNCNGRSP